MIVEAKRIISSLDLVSKVQVIRDIIDKCIVKGGNTVEVIGHLPLFAVNMGYEPISRDGRNTTRPFVPGDPKIPSIPFHFVIKLPSPRKAREILQRDQLGRIMETKAPTLPLDY